MATRVLGRVAPLYKGNYSNSTNYIKFDVAFDGESSFISKQGTAEAPNVGHALTDETWWGLLCKGNYLAIQPLTDRVTELESDVSGLDADTVQLRSDLNEINEDVRDKLTIRTDITQYFTEKYTYATILENGELIGGGTMKAMKLIASGGDVFYVGEQTYIASTATRLYAFYSSRDTFSTGTYISGGELIPPPNAVYVEYTISAPAGTKSVVILTDRFSSPPIFKVEKLDYANADYIINRIDKGLKQVINKSASKNIIYVRKDGTGDFTDIQSAINSIVDASISNRYEIRVCDDYHYTDMTELYYRSSPCLKNSSPLSPPEWIAAIITKDYVDIVGYNRRHKVSVHGPYDLAGSAFQNVHCLFLQGNCTISNMDFEIKNGRYAIHQEGSGSNLSVDYNAITILRNVDAIHLGNSDSANGSAWLSSAGQANGTCAGLQCFFENVKWKPSFYIHNNKNFDSPNYFSFKNCQMIYPKDLIQPRGLFIENYGAGQNIVMDVIGCNFFSIGTTQALNPDNVITDACHDVRCFIPTFNGQANINNVVSRIVYNSLVLGFETANNNVDISVVGGTAMPIIWGENLISYKGTPDAHGFACGTEYIAVDNGNFAFSLAHRLGNCTSSPKTLIVNIGGVDYTINLDVNFVTSDGSSYTSTTVPVYDNAAVVSYINTQLNNAIATISDTNHSSIFYPFKDACEIGYNYQPTTIYTGMPLRRDIGNAIGWRICNVGEKPQGVACKRMNQYDNGEIALIDNNLFFTLYGYSMTKYAKVGAGGNWTQADSIIDADLVDVFTSIWRVND